MTGRRRGPKMRGMGNRGPSLFDATLAAEVTLHLDRLLLDPGFLTARRSARLLRYIVERTLAGKADEIKEVVIALELYERDASYDPKVHSTVRVEACRLRIKLARYYAAAGVPEALRITIPKGRYVPRFERVAGGAGETARG